MVAGKQDKCKEYITTEAKQGSSLIEQHLIFFRTYHDCIVKVDSFQSGLTESKKEKLQKQMALLDEMIKECSTPDFYTSIEDITELAEV